MASGHMVCAHSTTDTKRPLILVAVATTMPHEAPRVRSRAAPMQGQCQNQPGGQRACPRRAGMDMGRVA